MSLSTTTTASYVLSKYSRSYPSSANATGTQQSNDGEWQHYTNPTIKLLLDATKTTSGELDSFRMKILWQMGSNDDMDRREVIFEDIDMLSFSRSLAQHNQPLHMLEQGLPLKAVYRDSVVGIRYLHPLTIQPGTVATYRRIQINFKDAPSVLNFIETISPICPCRANPAPPATAHIANLQRRSTIMNIPKQSDTNISQDIPHIATKTNPVRRSGTMMPSTYTDFKEPNVTHASNQAPDPLPSTQFPSASVDVVRGEADLESTLGNIALPRLPERNPHSLSRLLNEPSDYPTTTPTSVSSQRIYNSDFQPPVSDHLSAAESKKLTPAVLPCEDTSVPDVHMSSVAEPDNLASLDESSSNHSVPDPNPVASSALSDTLVPSLSKTLELYDLPTKELEGLVGRIVREPGFAQLLQSLDEMWRVKGLVEHM